MPNVVITRAIKLFQNYFILCRCPSEMILFERVETCPILFQNYLRSFSQLVNILQHVQCHRNNFEIISELFQQRLK